VLANPDMLLYIGTEKDAPGINATGWYYGNFTQFKYQAIAALFIIVFNAIMTFVILKVIGMIVPLRMDEKTLLIGDMAIHGEEAFPESSVCETLSSHVWPTRAPLIVGAESLRINRHED
jgi:Amt family ammonium transporter